MQVAVTGATGFIGRYLVAQLRALGHLCRCWYGTGSDRAGLDFPEITWVPGSLQTPESAADLVAGCDAVVHAALHHPGGGFRQRERGNLLEFCQTNIIGSLNLIEAARGAGVPRFIFISTCAVHDKILDDRPLDEKHPVWPTSHYGASKGAIEAFVHSYGWGLGYDICALRPTGVYGLAHPPQNSKWFALVQAVVRGKEVSCTRGGKEVHASDVARAACLLLTASKIAGESYNCYDQYVSDYQVAALAKQISGSSSTIQGQATTPRHQIETGKLRALGMTFGGETLLEQTVAELVRTARR